MSEVRPRYRSPSASVCVDVSLDEFSSEDLKTELVHRGEESASGGGASGGMFITEEQFSRIATLLICGQRQSAIDYINEEIIFEAIGRRL